MTILNLYERSFFETYQTSLGQFGEFLLAVGSIVGRSVKSGENVEEAFQGLARLIINSET